MTLLRHPVEPADYKRGYDDGLINAACNTLYGQGDRQLILDAMVARFARVLKRVKDGDSGSISTSLVSFTTQIDDTARAAILMGQFEISQTGYFRNIVGAQSSLFSGSGNRYEYSHEKASEVVSGIRTASGTALAAQRWDTVSNAVGSCPLYLEAKGGKIIEREVRPSGLWIIFADAIAEGDRERATDDMDIDEASVVIMQLSGTDRFAAWWGPSVKYPNGRHCVYTAKKFSDVPEPEDDTGREFTIQGVYSDTTVGSEMLANPLTLWAIEDKTSPVVYPFSILYGSPQGTDIMPVSTSLYEQCLEYDLTNSLILGAAGRGARGAQVVTSDANADPADVPDNTGEGKILMGRGKDLNFAGWSPTHAKAALDVLEKEARATAESESVPGDMAVRGDKATQESGYHYRLRMSKLLDYRTIRISMNRSAVTRRWEIERALINASTYKRQGQYTIPADTTETWNPGEYDIVKNPVEEMADWEARIKAGEASILDVVMSRRGFINPLDAIEWMTARKTLLENNAEVLDYFKPAAPAAAPARGGLFGPRG